MRVVLVSPNHEAPSEYFIKRHEAYLGARLAATFTYAPPVPGAPEHVVFGWRTGPLRNLRARIVHRLTGKPLLIQRFEQTVKGRRADLVLFEHGTAVEPLYRHCLRLGVPYAIHFHGGDVTARLPEQTARAMHEAAQSAAVNIANSEFIASRIRQSFGPVRVVVKHMGVDVPEPPPPLPGGPGFRICQLGRFTPKKGPLLTVKAFHRALVDCKQMELHMVGDGELRAGCEAYVRQQGVPQVTFHGALPHPEAMNTLRSCHAITQHSLVDETGDSEGFGVSLAEAMALGRPVVSTRHGPIPEVVEDGVTGILVGEGDWESQGKALVRLCRDRRLLAAMAAASHERAARLFSEKAEAASLLRILEGCRGPR
jgi:colanic acid/amylovoran biosynthesis glycosyltransferase